MKMRISRQSIYLLIVVSVMLVSVLLFAFVLLIPEGRSYRIARVEMKRHADELRQYEQWNEETTNRLKEAQSKHKGVINAFMNSFDAERFIKKSKSYFEELKLTKVERSTDTDSFAVYEVNASSKIDSPESFYRFLEGVSKSDWIIGVDLPIHFERVDELIVSSFTMKVFTLPDTTEEH